MNKLLGLILVLFFGATGCPKPSPTPVPPSPPGPHVIDASESETTREYTCADVCKHMFDLDCPAAKPTPRGATCLDVCQNIMTSGIISWNLACRSTAASCVAIDACK